jgi:hypothetical protein
MKLIDNYYKWLKEKTVSSQIEDWVEITTPYIDRHNDYMQIYIKKSGDSFILTDDGYTIDDLLISGVKLDSQKRNELLKITLNGFGIMRNDNELYVKANIDDFSLKKHNLVQAMLAVNDMFYTANTHVTNLFFEDVKNWMDSNKVIYDENIIFKGKSGFDRKFDFVIPKSRNSHERLIKVVNDLNKNTTDSFIMDWIDIREIKSEEPKVFVFTNDIDKVNSKSLDAFKHYNIQPILWSNKKNFIEELVA